MPVRTLFECNCVVDTSKVPSTLRHRLILGLSRPRDGTRQITAKGDARGSDAGAVAYCSPFSPAFFLRMILVHPSGACRHERAGA